MSKGLPSSPTQPLDHYPTPVFIKRKDGKSFREMKSEELNALIELLEEEMGLFAPGGITIAARGDLFIRPQNQQQFAKLLQISVVLHDIPVICSPPKARGKSKVVIHGVPLGDDNESILDGIRAHHQNVLYASRILKGPQKIPTATVVLEFGTEDALKEIFYGRLLYRSQPYIPHPTRCMNCNKFGHSKNSCKDTKRCPSCATSHNAEDNCPGPIRCINCNGSHTADSHTCPAFLKLKETAKLAIESGLSVNEARKQLTYSAITRTNITPQPVTSEVEILKARIQSLEAQMKELKSELMTIKSIQTCVSSLQATVETLTSSIDQLRNGQATSNSKLDRIIRNQAADRLDDDADEGDAGEGDDECPPRTGTKRQQPPKSPESQSSQILVRKNYIPSTESTESQPPSPNLKRKKKTTTTK